MQQIHPKYLLNFNLALMPYVQGDSDKMLLFRGAVFWYKMKKIIAFFVQYVQKLLKFYTNYIKIFMNS